MVLVLWWWLETSVLCLSVCWTWPTAAFACVCTKTNTADELYKHLSWSQISFCPGTTFESVGQCLHRGYTAVCTHTHTEVHHCRVIILQTQLTVARNTLQQEDGSSTPEEMLMFLLFLDWHLFSFSFLYKLSTFSKWVLLRFSLDEIHGICCNVCMSALIAVSMMQTCESKAVHLWLSRIKMQTVGWMYKACMFLICLCDVQIGHNQTHTHTHITAGMGWLLGISKGNCLSTHWADKTMCWT